MNWLVEEHSQRKGPRHKVQSRSGFISLCREDGSILALRHYSRFANRKDIIRSWVSIYGMKKMSTLYIHVTPDISL